MSSTLLDSEIDSNSFMERTTTRYAIVSICRHRRNSTHARAYIEGRGGIFIGPEKKRKIVVDPTRNNHRKWKHDVGHDIEAVSVLLSHDSTTASSAALLRRPSIPPIPGNSPPIPAATSPTTSFSTRCSPVIPRNYNHTIREPISH